MDRRSTSVAAAPGRQQQGYHPSLAALDWALGLRCVSRADGLSAEC
jgi:hypothetical protein